MCLELKWLEHYLRCSVFFISCHFRQLLLSGEGHYGFTFFSLLYKPYRVIREEKQ